MRGRISSKKREQWKVYYSSLNNDDLFEEALANFAASSSEYAEYGEGIEASISLDVLKGRLISIGFLK